MTDPREILKDRADEDAVSSEAKRPKREFMAFRGRRQPRVGQDFQVTSLPAAGTTPTAVEGTNGTK